MPNRLDDLGQWRRHVNRRLRELATLAMTRYAVAGIFDQAGHLTAGADPAGEGLARPYLPVPLTRADGTGTAAWPRADTDTFADMVIGSYYRQQPRLVLRGHVYATADAAGEVRLTANGIQLGPTEVLAAGESRTFQLGPLTTPGAYLDVVDLAVQARRTAGGGVVRLAVTLASQHPT